MLKKLCLTLLLAVACATAADLDRGGVTFDFSRISKERFNTPPTGQNLLTLGDFAQAGEPSDDYRWRTGYCYIHHPDKQLVDPWLAPVRKLVTWEISDGIGIIRKDDAIADICGEHTPNVSGAWSKLVKLPNLKGGTYRLVFQYQLKHTSAGENCVLVQFRGPKGDQPVWRAPFVQTMQTIRFADSPGEWSTFSHDIVAPADTENLELVFRIDGTGEFRMRQVSLTASDKSEPLTLKLSPHGFLDGTFALSQNQPAVLTFAWKRNGAAAEISMKQPEMVLTLPDTVTFAESSLDCPTLGSVPVTLAGKPAVEHRISLRGKAERPARINGFDFYLVLPALVTTAAEPGTDLGLATCRIEENGIVLSNQETFRLLVIPPISVSQTPKLFIPGNYIGGRYYNYSDQGSTFLFNFLGSIGVRWLVTQPLTQNQLQIMRQSGITTITPELYYIANGYRIGPPDKRPPEVRYRYLGSSAEPDLAMAVCPIAIYEKGDYFQQHVVPMLRKNLEGTDGLWANWEPYMFTGRGCFCDRCRDNFARFVNIPLEQMQNEWPQELGRGRKYYDQAVRYRSLEHAKVVHTLHEAVIDCTGGSKSLGFIPGIAWIEMASFWRRGHHGIEQQAFDYAKKLRWIDPWGPYPNWPTQMPYVYRKASLLGTFIAAHDVRAQVNRDYQANERPKLHALPHGIQADAWVAQPEGIEMQMNAFFFNGWEAATLYIFPRGYDNRYWAAYARAAEMAARCENFVVNGKRQDERVTVTPLTPYALPCSKVTDYLPELRQVPMLQTVAYALDDTLLVPLFNFWEHGETFCRLQVSGLEPDAHYQVSTADALFIPETGRPFFTGRALAEGIMVHVGALRCQPYTISRGTDLQRPVTWTAADLLRLSRERSRELGQAAAADRQYEKLYGTVESKLTDLQSGSMTCTADSERGLLSLRDGNNTLVINCRTMSVTDWQIDGRPLLGGTDVSGFATPAFWDPSFQLKDDFHVTRQTAVDGGIRIVGECRINNQMSTDLDGLLVRQTFAVGAGARQVSVTTELVNRSTDEAPRAIRAAFRYHFFPFAPAEKEGRILLENAGGTLTYTRTYSRQMYSTGDQHFEQVIKDTFGTVKPAEPITSGNLTLQGSTLRAKVETLPREAFAGFALWDGSSQLTTTFEPCFKMAELPKSGDAITYQISLTVE